MFYQIDIKKVILPKDYSLRKMNKRRDFRDEKLCNDPPGSMTDLIVPLFRKRKGKKTHLIYLQHDIMEGENRIILLQAVNQGEQFLEWDAALKMMDELIGRWWELELLGLMIDGDKNY